MSTLDHQTRSDIGRAANRKGKVAEQAVARYLRENGWLTAERMVRTGWKVGDKTSADLGDIAGTPGLCWQVKTSASDFTDTAVRKVLADTADQAVAGGSDYGVAVERRAGKASPAHWFAWLPARDLYQLIEQARNPEVLVVGDRHLNLPVRLLLEDFLRLLRAAGYGTHGRLPSNPGGIHEQDGA